MTLSENQQKYIHEIAELEVRKYFDHYQTQVFPTQLKSIIDAHNQDQTAHGGVERRVNRAIWILVGVALASGGTGALIAKVMGWAV